MEVADADRVLVTERPNATSAAVQGPIPGTDSSRAYASSSGMSTIASNHGALAPTPRIRSARRCSTPNGWKAK